MSSSRAQRDELRHQVYVCYAVEAAIIALLLLGNAIHDVIVSDSIYIAWGLWACVAGVVLLVTSLVILNQFLEMQSPEVVHALGLFRSLLGFAVVAATLALSGAIPEAIDQYYRAQGYLSESWPGPLPEGVAIVMAVSLPYTLGLFLLMMYKGKLASVASIAKLLLAIVLTLPLLVVSYLIDFAQNYRF